MKKRGRILTAAVFLFLANNLFAQSTISPDFVLTIPADRRVDWHNVGDKVKPTYYNAIFNVLNYGGVPNDGSDDRQAIQNAIEAARTYILNYQGSCAAVI